MIPQNFLAVMRFVASGLASLNVEWALTGSLGMALQGMPLDVHDIDLQTDRQGAFEIQQRFSAHLSRPVLLVERERIRSLLGALLIDGVTVEIIGDMQKRLEDGSWESPVRVGDFILWVETAGMRLPVLSLEHEHEAYLLMGRLEKACLIWDWLHPRPASDHQD